MRPTASCPTGEETIVSSPIAVGPFCKDLVYTKYSVQNLNMLGWGGEESNTLGWGRNWLDLVKEPSTAFPEKEAHSAAERIHRVI